VILINGGARGGGPLLKIYETVRKAASHSNILVVCGKNAQLRDRIERRGDPRTRTVGFVQDVYRYIAAADIVITKPGALSAYEALARPSKNASAKDRVEEILREVGVNHFENLTVVEGDISLPDLGLNDSVRNEIASSVEEVWHCAASLSFQEEDRAEIFRMNL